MFHRIAHWLGWNYGQVITKFDENGELWVAFQCTHCGEISDKHRTKM